MFSQAHMTQQQEYKEPVWSWDVHADGVIFSYHMIQPILSSSVTHTSHTGHTSQASQTSQTRQTSHEKPTLLDYLDLSPVQIPGDP